MANDSKSEHQERLRPAQKQDRQPGLESEMKPRPKADDPSQEGCGKLRDRVGEPEEIAPRYVFLASDDASYMTGQVLHPNGGEIING